MKSDYTTEADHTFKTYMIMLSALVVGANAQKVSKFTEYPMSFVKPIAKNLKKNKIWYKGKTTATWFSDKKYGGTEFIVDSLVANGLVKKIRA
jgi:hypothetical protein